MKRSVQMVCHEILGTSGVMGIIGSLGCDAWYVWHLMHCSIMLVISVLIPGQYTAVLALCWHRVFVCLGQVFVTECEGYQNLFSLENHSIFDTEFTSKRPKFPDTSVDVSTLLWKTCHDVFHENLEWWVTLCFLPELVQFGSTELYETNMCFKADLFVLGGIRQSQ